MADTATPASSEAVPGEGIPHKSTDIKHLHRRRKSSDPFLNLATDGVDVSSLQAPSEAPARDDDKSGSVLMDLVLTPLHMITFILSLSMIDYRQRQWRLSQHPPAPDTVWYRVAHWSWLHPEPYQNYRDATWESTDNSAHQSAPDATFPGWSTQKKHRQVAKLAISDAFAIRGRVLVALLVWTALSLCAIIYAARRLYGWAAGM